MDSHVETGRGPERLRVFIRGAVQGVGFRPAVYRLARDLDLAGWVSNSAQGLSLEVEGPRERLDTFLARIDAERPPRSFIQGLEHSVLDPVGYEGFEIRKSAAGGAKTTLVLPDIATCTECLREVTDTDDRRHGYPFTNCTHCGPRFSIIEALPYDRPNTTMRAFPMCERCRAEYDDPGDRRFHAQPNACPECGPQLALWDPSGRVRATRRDALGAAAEAIRNGAIVAVKGLGGYHLMVDARDGAAVERLRERKHREEKPLALMVPSLEMVRACCEVADPEARLLRSPEAPIVLLRRRLGPIPVADAVAPGNPYLGVMVPYTPLHHLLLADLGFPVVATSGNLSEEPICTDEREALERLGEIADHFLVHDRPIARHVDDSVARLVAGRVLINRRARGYAPLPVTLETGPEPPATLAVGGHLKNTVAISVGRQVFLSQHIGDLSTEPALSAFRRVIADLETLYDLRPETISCDAHPDYLSSKHAEASSLPTHKVQHHYAHLLSCIAENDLEGPLVGVSWDGTGYGTDGTVWGGEFLRITDRSFERAGHLRTFRLPGGERAVEEPRRSAIGLLHEIVGEEVIAMDSLAPVETFSPAERSLLVSMIRKGLNAPMTSSAGRLFDAVAAILGIRQRTTFEGQAAMELEYAADGHRTDEAYPFEIAADGSGPMILDWAPMIRSIIEDLEGGSTRPAISARFHNTLSEGILAMLRRIGEERAVITGGCFQNRYLTERTVRRLEEEGIRVYRHQRIPPNDGGIALGQVLAVARERR